ncbi:hypothetical protein [Olivibacter domesticus]|uniref:3-hydroxymyristoyl/3-hydroxydecanoyl-(Acyl carrier protein) dehydratase n=1 Tax=Olivibacter domesticus TaxID=407022 RepID=A0A1H7JJ22_OLID1|nr:hypothetical protein [Olivibacter domesticus]SEK73940.1 hypothetical protein SAMN05661044_01016 [Olivibacter domesticus]
MEALATISPRSLALIHSQYADHSGNENNQRFLTQKEIFELIDVHTPYYALQDVFVLKENIVAARVTSESAIGFEEWPITMAEACRHLAILGSVASAMMNPTKSKHYYLAHKGTYKRVSNKKSTPGKQLTLLAECVSFDKRLAMAKACLIDEENELICGIDVSFHVIPQGMFGRLFAHGYRDYLPTISSPYIHKNKLHDLQFYDVRATATLGEIEEYHCSGHFPNYPALPVAVLLGVLHDLCIHLVHHLTNSEQAKIMVEECTLTADNLAMVADTVSLEVEQLARTGTDFRLRGIAKTEAGKIVGDITTFICLT